MDLPSYALTHTQDGRYINRRDIDTLQGCISLKKNVTFLDYALKKDNQIIHVHYVTASGDTALICGLTKPLKAVVRGIVQA